MRLALSAVLVALAGCRADAGSPPASALGPSAWTLTEGAGSPTTLAFGAEGAFRGETPCGFYAGTYHAAEGGFVGRRIWARVTDAPAAPCNDSDAAYLAALGRAEWWGTDSGRLRLGWPGGALVFQAAP